MTQGIGGYGGSDAYDRWQRVEQDSGPVKQSARDYCQHADSAISGFMCDERRVISDACRTGKSDVDRTLCDDKQLQAAQHGVWEATKDVLRMIFGGIIAKAGK
jgi:hypothetical protein